MSLWHCVMVVVTSNQSWVQWSDWLAVYSITIDW